MFCEEEFQCFNLGGGVEGEKEEEEEEGEEKWEEGGGQGKEEEEGEKGEDNAACGEIQLIADRITSCDQKMALLFGSKRLSHSP